MYDNHERIIIRSGNGVKLEVAVLMDDMGRIVTSEAEAHGRAVTMRYVRPENVFVADETGSSTREMGDGENGGEKYMAPVGETPRNEASGKHSHFTVVPFTNLAGTLVLIAIIFSGEKMKSEWPMGKDILVKWVGDNDDLLSNVGPGKYFPMGPRCIVDGKKVPCYCDCSPNGSMNSTILTRILAKMDRLGISKRGVDDDGTKFYPPIIVDGHISRMGLPFLKYVNDDKHRWGAGLCCPYGTSKTQFHDNEKQNAGFKCALVKAKRLRCRQKREHGLPADLEPEEIPIIVKAASDATYAIRDFATRTFSELGMLPFTRAVLDDPDILATASPEVQAERGRIMKLRNKPNNRMARIAPNQIDLSTTGSGRLMGGASARNQINEIAGTLNTSGATASSLLTIIQGAKSRNDARRRNNEGHELRRDEMLDRYRKTKKFTAGTVFFSGNGELDEDVLGEVQRQFDYRQANAAKIEKKKKSRLLALQREVNIIKQIMQKKGFKPDKLKVPQLKAFCRWKKQTGDRPLPTKKAELIRRFNQTKGNPSPHVSPCNSDAEESDNDDDVESMDSDASAPENDDLIFGFEDEEEDESVSDGDDSEMSGGEDDGDDE